MCQVDINQIKFHVINTCLYDELLNNKLRDAIEGTLLVHEETILHISRNVLKKIDKKVVSIELS